MKNVNEFRAYRKEMNEKIFVFCDVDKEAII